MKASTSSAMKTCKSKKTDMGVKKVTKKGSCVKGVMTVDLGLPGKRKRKQHVFKKHSETVMVRKSVLERVMTAVHRLQAALHKNALEKSETTRRKTRRVQGEKSEATLRKTRTVQGEKPESTLQKTRTVQKEQ